MNKSDLIFLQLPIVVALIVMTFVLSYALGKKSYKLIGLGWICNLCYLIITIIIDVGILNGSILDDDQTDGLNFLQLLFSCIANMFFIQSFNLITRSNANNYKYPIIFLHSFNVVSFLWMEVSTIAIWMKFDSVNIEKELLIAPFVFASVASVISIALFNIFLKKIIQNDIPAKLTRLFLPKFNNVFKVCNLGIYCYSLTQIIYLFGVMDLVSSESENLIGFAFGFISKFIISAGYFWLFVEYSKLYQGIQAEEHKFIEISKEREQAKISSLGRLLHEISTPSFELHEYIKQFNEDLKLKRNQIVLLEEMENANNRSQAIIEASRTEHFGKVIRVQKINNLNTILELALSSVRKTHNLSFISFDRQYASNCYVYCIQTEIVQAVINILKNAIEAIHRSITAGHIEKGKILLRTKTYKNQGEPEVRLNVIDNGGGIVSSIGDEYKKEGYSSSSEDGRGFGIKIIIGLVNKNNGHCSFDNVPLFAVEKFSQTENTNELEFKGLHVVLSFDQSILNN